MDCLHPRTIRNPVFKSKRFKVDSEFRKLHELEPEYVVRPCGKCLNCMKKRQNEWAFRIQSEARSYFGKTFFVTLTFDDDHLHTYFHQTLPADIRKALSDFKKTGDLEYERKYKALLSRYLERLKRPYELKKGYIKFSTSVPSIDKKDLTDFFKRLRKSGLNFRYFACGEYGDKFARAHYHVIFFTEETFTFDQFHDRIYPYWNKCVPEELKVSSISTMINGIPASKYVAKYSVKRVGYNYKDCQVPFAIMSKCPPIGAAFLTADNYRQLRENQSTLVYDYQGTPYALSRYYRNKIFTESERKFLSDKAENLKLQKDMLSARMSGLTLETYQNRLLNHNLFLEKQYFARLALQRFGYDFELNV